MAPCHPTALRGASLLLSGSHVAAESDAAADAGDDGNVVDAEFEEVSEDDSENTDSDQKAS